MDKFKRVMTKINLDRSQKIAFARIISDLIEADFIVDESEMEYFEKIISKDGFSISDAMLIEAKKMNFADAVLLLKELDAEARRGIVDSLKGLAMADGTCVPLEAIQIFALEQALEHDAAIYSVKAENIGIENMKVIYIENEDNTSIAGEIEANLRSVCNEFALAGFDFVLIPHVVRDYSMMKRAYLERVVRYMIPSVSKEKVSVICNDLCGMTTARFCKNILYKKIDMPLTDAGPSLLIKINESATQDLSSSEDALRTDYANFLRIELDDDLLSTVRELLDRYRSMINAPIMIQNKPLSKKFLYYGFHRSLFDLIAYGREKKEYSLFIDITGRTAKLYFQPVDGDGERIQLKLNPQETALYIMMIKRSLKGRGLDWRENIPAKDKRDILAEYNKIYSRIGKGNTANEYKDRTQVNHIKNKIRAIQCIANVESFLPVRDKGKNISFYRVPATRKEIFILE